HHDAQCGAAAHGLEHDGGHRDQHDVDGIAGDTSTNTHQGHGEGHVLGRDPGHASPQEGVDQTGLLGHDDTEHHHHDESQRGEIHVVVDGITEDHGDAVGGQQA